MALGLADLLGPLEVSSGCKEGCCSQLGSQERMLLLHGVCAVPPALPPSCTRWVVLGGTV